MTAVEEAPADWRTLLPSELRRLRKQAVDAGYVNPFPAKGKAVVTTIDDRCPACRKTLFVTMQGEVKCAYEQCTEYNVVGTMVEEQA